jgi:serine/threonine protein kinase
MWATVLAFASCWVCPACRIERLQANVTNTILFYLVQLAKSSCTLLPYGCRYSKNLAQEIAGSAPNGLPLARILRYAAQALAALQELHSREIAMTDLKPQNLLLEEVLDEVVAADFGLSRFVNRTLGGFRMSTASCGTPNYM